jgi:hypothetical protein
VPPTLTRSSIGLPTSRPGRRPRRTRSLAVAGAAIGIGGDIVAAYVSCPERDREPPCSVGERRRLETCVGCSGRGQAVVSRAPLNPDGGVTQALIGIASALLLSPQPSPANQRTVARLPRHRCEPFDQLLRHACALGSGSGQPGLTARINRKLGMRAHRESAGSRATIAPVAGGSTSVSRKWH